MFDKFKHKRMMTKSNDSIFGDNYQNIQEQYNQIQAPTRIGRLKQKFNNSSHHTKTIIVCVVSSLVIVILVIGGIISYYTLQNVNKIQRSKTEQNITNYKDNDKASSIKARHAFDEKYKSMLSDTDNTDININDNQHDIYVLHQYLNKISDNRKQPYQKKYNNIRKKVKIQLAFNNFFVRNNPSNKTIKPDITPDDVYKFNKKYNMKIQQIYDANSSDAFAHRMNMQQNKLTSDATNLLNIYNDTTKLYSKLGSKNNNWTYKLNSNVIPKQNQLNDSNLSILNDKNSDKKVTIQSLSEIQDKIKRLNFNWDNHLDLVKKLLSASNSVAANNFDNISKLIQQIQDEKAAKEAREQQDELNNILATQDFNEPDSDDIDNSNNDNSSTSSESSSSSSDNSSNDTTNDTQTSNVGGNNDNQSTYSTN